MKHSLFLKACLFGLAAAGSAGHEPAGHEYQKIPGASRSPCPGLNALANHGFLPRSGENIDLGALRAAVVAGYNFEPAVVDNPFALVVGFGLSSTGNSSTFHLADLDRHDAIEFDGSLSRNDYYLGDNSDFDPAIWATVARHLRLYATGPAARDRYVTVEAAAGARAARVRDAMRANDRFNASENQMQGSPGTSALYLTTLWDFEADAAPKAWVRSFFEEERIPFREGYNPHGVRQRTLTDLGTILTRLKAVKIDAGSCAGKSKV